MGQGLIHHAVFAQVPCAVRVLMQTGLTYLSWTGYLQASKDEGWGLGQDGLSGAVGGVGLSSTRFAWRTVQAGSCEQRGLTW